MPRRLDRSDPGFEAAFEQLLNSKRETDADVDDIVSGIISDVIARGDAALIDLTERFDRVRLTPETLRFSADEIAAARASCDPETLEALQTGPTEYAHFTNARGPTTTA